MTTTPTSVTPTKLLALAQSLSADDLTWLIDQLHKLATDVPLPENASLDQAITLLLADQCSVGRAAELAGVTRWDILEELAQRDIPIQQGADMTVEEMERQFEQLETMGLL